MIILFLFYFFPLFVEASAALIYHVGQRFHEVFQLKQGLYADIPAAKLTELMKSNSLDVSHPAHDVVNGNSWTRYRSFLGVYFGFILLTFKHLIFTECPNSVTFECCEWNSR